MEGGVTETNVPTEEVGELSKRSDADIEQRMSEIEGDFSKNKEFSSLEKEMEKRERASVFSVPLENVSSAIDVLIKKDKEQPNGFGSFIEKRDASETKSVAQKYLTPSEISDDELKKDFRDAVMGNPDTWYADGLKLRESLKEASRRGINTNELVVDIEREFIKDGYSKQDAQETVARKLTPIFKESTNINQTANAKESIDSKVKELETKRDLEIDELNKVDDTFEFLPIDKVKGVEVEMEVEVAETGKKQKVMINALKAQNELKKRVSMFKKLKDCVG